MMRTEIEINFNRKDFEEIFFRDFNGDYLRSPTTIMAFRRLAISILILVPIFIISIVKEVYFPIVAGGIWLIIVLVSYIIAFRTLRDWKVQVSDYLNRDEKYLRNKVILTDDYISVIQDDKETMEKWSTFSSATISDDYADLRGKENFLIPRKCMTPENYINFKKIVSEKLK